MSAELLGTIRADGSLELDEKVALPPGRVRVYVEPEPVNDVAAGEDNESLVDFVARLRREALAAGAKFMTDAEATAWVEELRADDDRIEQAYRDAAEARSKD